MAWASLLGIVGALLAVPLTLFVKFVLECFEESRGIAKLMAADTGTEAEPGPPSR
jgi:predicted PurR-regulated permease PerM